MREVALEERHNNPIGAGCREILVVTRKLSATAQPERWSYLTLMQKVSIRLT